MTINLSERHLEWSEKIKNQKLSNKSGPVWCREQGISYHTFQYWQKKIKNAIPQKAEKSIFFEIPEDQPYIEISIPGVKLELSRNFDRIALMHFLSLLKVE